jgi:hypothetical protein
MWLLMGNKTHQPEGTRRRQVASRYLTMYCTRLAQLDIPIKRRDSAQIHFIPLKKIYYRTNNNLRNVLTFNVDLLRSLTNRTCTGI